MLTNTVYSKFVADNLVFLNEVHESFGDLDEEYKPWCGELALLFRKLVLQVYAAQLHRESCLTNKLLRVDASQVPKAIRESLEKYLDCFRKIPDAEIAEFLLESLPKMASVQDDLRKLLKIKGN